MSFASFLADHSAVREWGDWLIWLRLTTPSGPLLTPETLDLYFSRHGTTIGKDDITIGADSLLANQPFEKRLLTIPTFQQSLWAQGSLLDRSFPNYGQFVLNNRDGGLDQYAPSAWVWDDAPFKAYFGIGRKRAYLDLASTIGKTVDGRLGEPDYGLSTVTVPVYGHEKRFDVQLSDRVYRGTSYMLELFGDRTVSYGSPAALSTTGDMTAETWLWLEALPTAVITTWGWFGLVQAWKIRINPDGTIVVSAHIGGVLEAVTSTAALSIKKPYHLEVTITGRHVTFDIWDDDAKTLTTELHLNAFSSATRDTASGGAGFVHRSGNDATFKIWFDESRLWNVARTADERASTRHGEIPDGAIPASLVHYIRFNNGTGTTVTDSSATAAHGTIAGAGTSTWLWAHEGNADLAGTPKPDIYGRVRAAKPVLVDPLNSGYQFAGDGAIQAFNSIMQGGYAGYTSDGDAASFRAYITATVALGHVLTYKARGLFRLGGPPSLPLSGDISGYNGGPHGYTDDITSNITDISDRRGPQLTYPGDYDTSSFTTFETAAGNPLVGVQYQQPNSVKINEVFDLLARSGAGWWGYTRASDDLHVERYVGPASTANHNFTEAQIIGEPRGIRWQRIREIVVRYAKADVVLTDEDIAASAKSTADWQKLTKEWLEVSRVDTFAPAASSRRVVIDTALYYQSAASALVDHLASVLFGQKHGWAITLNAAGLNVSMGQTCTISLTALNGEYRLGLSGVVKYLILSVSDQRQQGIVNIEVLS